MACEVKMTCDYMPNSKLMNSIQLTKKSEKKEKTVPLDFDLSKPLRHGLKSVFDHGGMVLLAFPDSTYIQVSLLYCTGGSLYMQLSMFIKGEKICRLY